MKSKNNTLVILLVVSALFTINGYAQKMTRVKGKIIDAQTKEPLPFANVIFAGKNIGATTDDNGNYSIETQWASSKIEVSFIGYITQTKNVILNKKQILDFQLEPEHAQLEEIVLKTKKKRYRNKDNLAVELIHKIVKNKNANRKESLDYYEYDKYEKNQVDINNVTKDFQKKRVFKDIQFIFNSVDTSKVNGKPFLPIFLKETRSKIYYRKNPKKQKTYILGTNNTGFEDYIDSEGVGNMIDEMYQDIDLYDNNVMLLTNQFVSPISVMAPSVYKFYINDTLDINGYNCIKLFFRPRNKQDLAFTGNLYITNDDRYAVVKADLKISKDINLNFIKDLQIIQEFSFIDNKSWMITSDKLIVDLNLRKKGIGMFGRKTIHYDNFALNKVRKDRVYKGIEKVVNVINYNKRDAKFWKESRTVALTAKENNIYTMLDSVQKVPAFRRTMDIITLFVTGYWNFDKIDIGPVNTFYSFNDVEGLRLRFGGKTSNKLSEKFRLEAYGIYGFKDEKFKYSAKATWSLNNKPLKENPKHFVSAQYQYETNFPGMEVEFINEDNFLLSFKRGVADKIVYNRMYKLEHHSDWKNGFSTSLSLRNMQQEPGGTLNFIYEDGRTTNTVTSSEVVAKIRFAPNEKFIQGMDYKTPIITADPIFQLSYTQGIKDVFNADYTYSKLKFNGFKRFYIAPLGYTNTEIESGKIFGEVPFPLLDLPRANQTYSYQLRSYNMMNFLEFANDQYVSLFAEHHFNGFIMNRIPLFKKLKWRSIVSFKGIYGSVSDQNNPEVTAGLMQFPTDADGNTTTYSLKDKPYMEASVGLGNIFKFFRVDLVKRLTYLENPNASEYGVRARFKFDF